MLYIYFSGGTGGTPTRFSCLYPKAESCSIILEHSYTLTFPFIYYNTYNHKGVNFFVCHGDIYSEYNPYEEEIFRFFSARK